jgi:AmiR/NasT family two-component response regulator
VNGSRVRPPGDERSLDELRERIAELERQRRVDHELIAHLEAEGATGRDTIANLERALLTSRRISTAVGMLMATRRVTEDAAFNLLRLASQRSERKLRDVAEDVITSETTDR